MEDFTIFVATWNVGTSSPNPSDCLKAFLGLEANGNTYVNVPDLYVIGLQEVKSQPQNMVWDTLFEDPWTLEVKTVLTELGLVKLQTARLQGIVTSVFIKRRHLTYIRDIEFLSTRRGLGGIWGNKGAVSLRFGIHGCSICLVNCHLTPHDHMLNERIEDYKSILSQTFSNPETSNILFHDYIFWFGDFNFRLGGSRTASQIVELISENQMSVLMKDDQLFSVQKTGDAFSELRELPLTFPPSYKFEAGVDNYDIKRRPAWTDRILYQVNANVYDNVTLKMEGGSYKSHMHYRSSDHRPVTAAFKITVFRPTVEKLIEFLPLTEWHLGESNKVFYRICSTLETSSEDWIAIYKADFTGLDEYLAYVYVPVLTPEEQATETTERSVVFSENSLSFRGSFVLIYFSRAPRSVYGISSIFESVTRI